jgi:hypothetical protein
MASTSFYPSPSRMRGPSFPVFSDGPRLRALAFRNGPEQFRILTLQIKWLAAL